ncbi:MAG: zinc-binding dehydrogenase [Variibacter sp.]|nr:zinc-binding dehydrogenase [Variibacter sp.]
MKAAVIADKGLEIRDVPAPRPKAGEVLVRVRACGINRADLHMAAGHRHGPLGGVGAVAGMEFAGEVMEVGKGVGAFKPGDRVMCSGSAAFAEQAVADGGRTYPVPDGLSFEQAAALPIALQTMHDAIITNGAFKPGYAVLIQGASSGVGLMGMQIAKAKGARLVIGTSTNPERRARLKEYGADLALDSRDPGWVGEVLKATGDGVDIVVDMVSGYVANQNLEATRVLGRIVAIGRLGGMKGEFDFDLHSRKRIWFIGASFRTRSIEEIREICRRAREDLWDDLLAGRLRMPLDRTFPLEEVSAALAHAKANAHFGKIVLTV